MTTVLYGVLLLIIGLNFKLIILLITSPILRILTLKRLKHDNSKNIEENTKNKSLNESINNKHNSIFTRIKLLLASYHSRLALYWLGNIPSHCLRNFFYKKVYGMKLSENTIIYYGIEFRCPWNIEIGKGSILGDRSILDASKGITIGENVNFSSGVSVYTLQHDHRDMDFNCNPGHYGSVKIGNRVWVGPNAIILPNITIGEGSVIAAGAVVTQNVPPYEIWGGIPAKKIGNRNTDINYVFDGFHSDFL